MVRALVGQTPVPVSTGAVGVAEGAGVGVALGAASAGPLTPATSRTTGSPTPSTRRALRPVRDQRTTGRGTKATAAAASTTGAAREASASSAGSWSREVSSIGAKAIGASNQPSPAAEARCNQTTTTDCGAV